MKTLKILVAISFIFMVGAFVYNKLVSPRYELQTPNIKVEATEMPDYLISEEWYELNCPKC